MEYILKNVPPYERANEQLNQVSRKWQAEVEALNTEASLLLFLHDGILLSLLLLLRKEHYLVLIVLIDVYKRQG